MREPKGVTMPRSTRAFFLTEGYIDDPTDQVACLCMTSAEIPTCMKRGGRGFQIYGDYEIKGFVCGQLAGRACGNTIA